MKNSNIVKPTGLKGNDKLNRMRELMGSAPINEGITRSVVELTKQGPDGNVYAIVRENHEYYIKVSEAKSNLVTEDFQYMGGLQNKKDKVYTSYAKAIKQLNLKFMSINEAAGKSGSFDTFKSDGLLTEHHGMNPNATLSASKAIGDSDEYVINKKGDNLKYDNKEGSNADGFGDNVAPGKAEADVEKVKLSENETAIDKMIEYKECKCDGDCKCRKDVVEEMITGENSDLKGRIINIFNQFNSEHPELVRYAKPAIYLLIESIEHEDDSSMLEYIFNNEADSQLEFLSSIPNPNNFFNPDAEKILRLFFAKINSEVMNEPISEQAPKAKKGFSIARAIQEMDEVIDSIATEDDKVNDILESLGDTEKAIMMEALNKNVNEIEKKIHKDKKPAFTDKEQAEIDSVVGRIDTDKVESKESKESEESEVKKKD